MGRLWRRDYEASLPDDRLPINVLPYANEEFFPAPASAAQREIYRQAMQDIDEAASRHAMSRRRFLQTGAAFVVTMGAINRVMGTAGGSYALAGHGAPDDPCVLHHPGAQLNNLPGEFILDIQTHHVDADGAWRESNRSQEAFFSAVWRQSNCGEADRIACLGRFHYVKELFLDSATSVCVLSAVPFREDGQPLPIAEAAETCGIVNELAASRRAVMHRFVQPNRGSLGHAPDEAFGAAFDTWPRFMSEELDAMSATAQTYGAHLRAWKVYTPWGDVPYAGGWWLDGRVGRRFIEHVIAVGNQYDVPKMVCAHKGFALPAFDQEKAATRDVGVVAAAYPEVSFVVYHSGYDGDGISIGGPVGQGSSTRGPYPLDVNPVTGRFELGAGSDDDLRVRSSDRGVDNLIKALRENGWSARHFAPGGEAGRKPDPFSLNRPRGDGDPSVHANVPNVYAELGSVWANVMSAPARASYLLGKLIYYVGPKRVVWGTDSLWGGSPQGQIVSFRAFQMSQAIRDLYRLPFGLDGDVDHPQRDALDARSYTPVAQGGLGVPPGVGGWPQDGIAHPERTIRNGILGRNIAPLYRIDPEATLNAIACDSITQLREGYQDAHPMAAYEVHGSRTVAGVLEQQRADPWFNGARLRRNEARPSKRLI